MKKIAIAVAMMGLAATACTAVPAASPRDIIPTDLPTTLPTRSPSVSPEPSEPTTYVLYQRSLDDHDGLRVNRMALDGSGTRAVASTEHGEGFVASPNGRRMLTRLITRTPTVYSDTLIVLHGGSLQRRTTLFRSHDGYITGMLWSQDGATIFFAVTYPEDLDEPSKNRHEVYRVNPNGSGLRKVASIEPNWHYGFADGALHPSGDLWYVEQGEGGYSGLTRIDPETGRSWHRDVPFAGTEIHFTAFSPDGRTLYYADGRRVRALDLATSDDRILYSVARGHWVSQLLATPDGTGLLVLDGNVDGPGATTRLVDTSNGTTDRIYKDPSASYVGPAGISPDGRSVWFETQCHCDEGTTVERWGLYDVQTGAMRFYDLPQNQAVRLLGFLVA